MSYMSVTSVKYGNANSGRKYCCITRSTSYHMTFVCMLVEHKAPPEKQTQVVRDIEHLTIDCRAGTTNKMLGQVGQAHLRPSLKSRREPTGPGHSILSQRVEINESQDYQTVKLATNKDSGKSTGAAKTKTTNNIYTSKYFVPGLSIGGRRNWPPVTTRGVSGLRYCQDFVVSLTGVSLRLRRTAYFRA